MTTIPTSPHPIQITDHAELAHAPTLAVRVGAAPDGLPWIMRVDRSHRLRSLFNTVLSVFDLHSIEQLPRGVRAALENDVASGLMGVHVIEIQGQPQRVYVSRNKLKRLLGATLLSQTLESKVAAAWPGQDDPGGGGGGFAATNVAALAAGEFDEMRLAAVERSIEERSAKRHLLLGLEGGQPFSGSVGEQDKALRTPTAPYRPLVFESLERLGAWASFRFSGREAWRVRLTERSDYLDALLRASQSGAPASLEFEIPRARLAGELATFAREISALHDRGLVHGDIAPGNVLFTRVGPVSFDSLNLHAGTPAVAATFDWAAPEQIVGLPVDPQPVPGSNADGGEGDVTESPAPPATDSGDDNHNEGRQGE